MKKLLFLFLLIGYACRAQTVPGDVEDAFIEVTGSAEMEVIPDEIYISFSLKERFIEKEKLTIANLENKVKDKLKALGINLTDVSLASTRSDEVLIDKKRPDLIKQNEYLLKTNKPELVEPVLRALESENAHNAYISKIAHSKIEDYKQEVRLKAVRSAKIKSQNLLNAIGEIAGRAIYIIEKEAGNENIVDAKDPRFLKIYLTYKVTGRFEIE